MGLFRTDHQRETAIAQVRRADRLISGYEAARHLRIDGEVAGIGALRDIVDEHLRRRESVIAGLAAGRLRQRLDRLEAFIGDTSPLDPAEMVNLSSIDACVEALRAMHMDVARMVMVCPIERLADRLVGIRPIADSLSREIARGARSRADLAARCPDDDDDELVLRAFASDRDRALRDLTVIVERLEREIAALPDAVA